LRNVQNLRPGFRQKSVIQQFADVLPVNEFPL
jgi:hypothetical protein